MTRRTTTSIILPDIVRFWDKVLVLGPDDCWPWMASRSDHGYGWFYAGKHWYAHRFALTVFTGQEQPPSVLACHTCDFEPCCNPEHLFWGNHKDNADDASRKGRLAIGQQNGACLYPERLAWGDRNWTRLQPERVVHGEEHGMAKLTEAGVVDIRRRYATGSISIYQIAREYGVSRDAIRHVINRRTWRHVV